MMNLQEVRMSKEKEPLTKKEKLNRNILIACGLAGGVIGASIVFFNFDTTSNFQDIIDDGLFSSSNIPAAVALAIAAFWGIALPIIAYFWHKKAIDEQEAAAYRDGAYYAAYVYIIGAPTWWILARGGLVPQINGVVIFIIFNFIWLGVWFYKKYR
jgi:hypothetical protein